MEIHLITAFDKNYGIGKNNDLPWKIELDMKFFLMKTKGACVVMGKNTWMSLPEKSRGMKNRINVVISSTSDYSTILEQNKSGSECHLYKSIGEFLSDAPKIAKDKKIFIIGGSSIYKECICKYSHWIKQIYITNFNENFDCDIFFPYNDMEIFLNQSEVKKRVLQYGSTLDKLSNQYVFFEIIKYDIVSINKYEYRYLNLLQNVLEQDKIGRVTRNGITYSTFGSELEFDVSERFPLLTTKKMFLRGIFEELLFFIRGETNSKLLEEKGVNIWKGNTSSEFLQSRNLPYEEGDMGPMYGFQWRYFGTEYHGYQHNYKNKGYDQLYQLILSLTNDPYSRRHLLTTYDPSKVEQSVLAPCHGIVCQFYVQDNYLDCKMYQRSCDLFLGCPFNISSYGLLLLFIANVTKLKPRKLIISFGDVHIYKEHLKAVHEQISRSPFQFPILKIKKDCVSDTIEGKLEFLETLTFDDIELSEYQCHSIIRAPMIA